MTLPVTGYVQQVEIVVGGTLPRAGFVQPVDVVGGGGGMAIGGTVTGGVAGRILFVGAGSVLAQDAALTFDSAAKKVTLLGSGGPQQRWAYDGSNFTDALADSVGDFYLKPTGATIIQKQGSNTTELWIDGAVGHDSFLYLTEGLSVKWSIYRDGGDNNDLRIDDDSDTRLRIYQGTGNVGFGSSSNPLFWDNASLILTVDEARIFTPNVDNLFIGRNAGNDSHTGDGFMVGIGRGVMSACTTSANPNGFKLTGVGFEALKTNTTGWNNAAFGYHALQSNTTGSSNVAIGMEALNSNVDGIKNTALGEDSMYFNTSGNFNVAVGIVALYKNTTGSRNIGIGQDSGRENQTGSQNTSVGDSSLMNSTTSFNVGVGADCLIAQTSGAKSTAVGAFALSENTTGSQNVAVGYAAGINGGALLATANSVFLGHTANASTNGLSNVIALGYQAQASASNSCVIGNSSLTLVRAGATATTDLGSSSVKWKDGYFSGQITVPTLTGSVTVSGQTLAIDHSGSNPRLDLYENGTHTTRIQSASQDVYIDAIQASASIVLRPNGQTERMRLGAAEIVMNDTQADVDVRIEGDSLSHFGFFDATATTENIALLAAAAPNWQTMDRGLFIGDTSNAPTGNPTAGGFLYSESGAGKWRGSGGTVTTFGPAEPHCEVCGSDYGHEWANKKWGRLQFCVNCLTDHITKGFDGKLPRWIKREGIPA